MLKWNGREFEDDGMITNSSGLATTSQQSTTSSGLAANGTNFDFSGVTKQTAPDVSFGDKFKSWFTPKQGTNTSIGGQVLGGVGAGVGALRGLAGMYFAKKNYDLQKDNQDYLRNREAQSDMRKSKFAANAGNNASY